MESNEALNRQTAAYTRAVVVTSIASPNEVLKAIAEGCAERGMRFYVIGDTKSPQDFALDNCDFFDIARQESLGFNFAALCPLKHYARKNIGYLQAIRDGVEILFETDDDNLPRPDFYRELDATQTVPVLRETGWVNVYQYFSDLHIWPRGLPLDAIQTDSPTLSTPRETFSPIQQGLADDNPDVDAIYRLLLPLAITFKSDVRLALEKNAWCPFNSQNTVFFSVAFPLLYLPAYCSFRMTDIWRSFVAQRIAWENGWSILFREATVQQFRNDHRLMKDFEDEIPGYLHNRSMGTALAELELKPGINHIPDNMKICYEMLVAKGWVGKDELPLLGAWLEDLRQIKASDRPL